MVAVDKKGQQCGIDQIVARCQQLRFVVPGNQEHRDQLCAYTNNKQQEPAGKSHMGMQPEKLQVVFWQEGVLEVEHQQQPQQYGEHQPEACRDYKFLENRSSAAAPDGQKNIQVEQENSGADQNACNLHTDSGVKGPETADQQDDAGNVKQKTGPAEFYAVQIAFQDHREQLVQGTENDHRAPAQGSGMCQCQEPGLKIMTGKVLQGKAEQYGQRKKK